MSEYDDLLAGGGNEYDALLSGRQAEQRTSVRTSLSASMGVNPDQHAKALSLAQQTGAPADVVARHLPEIEQKQTLDEYDQLLGNAPVAASFLAQPDHAKLAHDDIAGLTGLEWLLKAPVAAFQAGGAEVEANRISYRQLLGAELTPDDLATLSSLEDKAKQEFGNHGWLQGALVESARVLPQLGNAIGAGLNTGLQGAIGAGTAAAIAGQAGPQVALPEEILTVPGAAAAGFAVASRPGATMAAFEQEAGGAWREFSQIKDEQGNPLDPEVARMAAVVAGAANASLEMFGLETLIKSFPGADKILGHMTRDGLREMLKVPAIRDAFKNFAMGYGKVFATETVTEVVQEAVTMYAGELMKLASDGEFAMLSGEEQVERLQDVATKTAQAMTFLAGGGPGLQFTSDVQRAREAKGKVEAFNETVEAVRGSKLLGRSKEAFEAFVEEAAGAEKSVFLPAEQAVAYMQGLPVDEASRLVAELGVSDQLAEALSSGGDLVVPLVKYLSTIAPTQHHEALVPFLRTEWGAMTLAEAEAFNAASSDILAREAEAQIQAMEVEKAAQAAPDRVFDDVFAQLRSAGRAPEVAEREAAVTRAFFRTMGERAGLDPFDLYQRYGLKVQGVLPQSLREKSVDEVDLLIEKLRRANVKTDKELFGDSLLEYIARKGGLRDDGGELAGLDLDAWHRGKPFRAKLVKDQGLSLDDMMLDAWENGYFPEFTERPEPSVLIDAIAEEMRGNRRYVEGREDTRAVEERAVVEDLQRVLDQLGLDAKTASNEDIKQALAQYQREVGQGGYDQGDPRNLVVMHNLSAANLLHAVKIGGLAVPSVAVARVESPLSGFGEISLIAGSEMVDPKRDRAAKTFDADVYSPRYPTVAYKIATPKMRKAWSRLDKASADLGHVLSSELDDGEVTRKGVAAFRESSAVRLTFLRETGREVDLPREKATTSYLLRAPELKALLADERGFHPRMLQDEAFVAAYNRAVTSEMDEVAKALGENPEELRGNYYTREGEPRPSVINQMVNEVRLSDGAPIDRYAAREAIRQAIDPISADFAAWVDDNFGDVIAGETIRTETRNGDWKYLPHTLDNVVKVLIKELRDGEGFNYGVGSVRSTVANQFRSVAAMQKARDRIVPSDAMAAIKEEADKEFVALAGELGQYAGKQAERFGWLDTVSEHLKEVAERNVSILDRYYDKPLPAEVKQKVVDFLDKLANLPTEYFEAKIQRAVDLSEFRAAVVPSDVDPKVRDALTRNGVAVVEYQRDDEASRAEAIRQAGETTDVLFQPDGGGIEARGRIQFSPGETVISLFEKADLSTFLHESGHFYLNVIRDLATDASAPDQIKADWAAVQSWLGVNGEITVDQHEQFARGFEAYLFEGKAPSLELQSLFDRFRAWLLNVYKTIARLNVELSPEIRGVFDRMLATDQEIAQAEQGARYAPLFAEAAEAGMTEAEFADYRAAAERATSTAEAELLAKALGEIRRERAAWWKDERAKVRAEVEAEINQRPVYQAFHFLATGTFLDGPVSDIAPVKLSKGALTDMFGPEVLKLLPKSVPPIWAKEGGAHPDHVAGMFGFDSGDQMIRAMLNMQNRTAVIEAETDVRMRDLHGDFLRDGRLEEEALNVVRNDDRGAFLAVELRAIARKAGKDVESPAQVAKRAAERMIAQRQVKDATQPGRYHAAERKAAREAEQAVAKGDLDAAARAKRMQLLNHYLGMEARKAAEEVDGTLRYLKKFLGRKATSMSIDPDYLARIRTLLDAYNLGPALSDRRRTLLELKAINDWIKAREADDGAVFVIPPAILEADAKTHYRTVSLETLRGLKDAVKNIETQGRRKAAYLENQERREFEATKERLLESIEAGGPPKTPGGEFGHLPPQNPTWWGKAGEFLADAKANLTKMEFLFYWLDGGKHGAAWELGFKPMAEAQTRSYDMLKTYAKDIRDILCGTKEQRKRWARRYDIPDIGRSLLGSEIMAVALNMGNEGNIDKLMRGYGWSEQQLRQITRHLTAEDWQTVQRLWDKIDQLYAPLAALHKRVTGVDLPKVEAKPLTVQIDGQAPIVLAGGYYPVKYDPRRSFEAAKHVEESQVGLFETTFLRPDVERGFTQERTGYAAPVLLSLDVIPLHVRETIHYLTHYEAVTQVDKLFRDPEVRQAISERVGDEHYRLIRKWLAAIANDAKPDVPANWLDKMLRHLRQGTTLVGMGFRLSTMLAQPMGLFTTADTIGLTATLSGLRAITGSPQKMRQAFKFAMDTSGELRHRMATFDRDVKAEIDRLTGATGPLDNVRRMAFAHIGLVDLTVATATWYGAYHQGLKDFQGDDAKAVAYADSAVRMSQSAGGVKDLSAFQRGSEAQKIYSLFYSYFSVLFNRLRDMGRAYNGPQDIPFLAARFMWLVTLPVLSDALLKGTIPDEDDEESWLEWFAIENLLYPAQTIPFVRDVVSGLLGDYGYGMTPIGGGIEAIINTAKDASDGELGDAFGRNAAKAVGVAARLPTGQAWTSSEYLWDYVNGEVDEPSLREMVYGRKKD
jgi:hypothetical protein